MSNYRQLKVWQKAHKLVLKLYKATEGFPVSERFGLVTQIRRAAVSIPTNIAEGQGRVSKKEYIRFLSISRGSAKEVEYLIFLCKDIGYLNEEDYLKLNSECVEILKMLNGLISSIRV